METQKEAVVRLVKARLGTNYDPTQACRDKLSKDDIETIRQEIVSGIKNQQIKYSGKASTDSALGRYVIGMITNHLRKTRELNGGLKRSQIQTKKKDDNVVKVNENVSVDTSVLPDELAQQLQES